MSAPAEPTITEAHITEEFGRASATDKLSDGSDWKGPSWFVDKLHFTAESFVGLTPAQARTLHHKNDVDFLQS